MLSVDVCHRVCKHYDLEQCEFPIKVCVPKISVAQDGDSQMQGIITASIRVIMREASFSQHTTLAHTFRKPPGLELNSFRPPRMECDYEDVCAWEQACLNVQDWEVSLLSSAFALAPPGFHALPRRRFSMLRDPQTAGRLRKPDVPVDAQSKVHKLDAGSFHNVGSNFALTETIEMAMKMVGNELQKHTVQETGNSASKHLFVRQCHLQTQGQHFVKQVPNDMGFDHSTIHSCTRSSGEWC